MSCKDISLDKELGSGGYGKVYSFKRKNKKVPDRVIKILHNKKTDKDGEERFKPVKKFDSLVEIDTLFRLKSTTITKGIEIYSPGECPEIKSVAIEMEALKDFKELINETEIDPIRKVLFIYRLAVAINCLHSKKILHLDVKPANMLYSLVDGIPYIKLSDFGLSHQIDDTELGFHTTTSFGTRKYKPPESLEVVRLSQDKYKKIGDDPFYDDFSSRLAFNYTSKFDVWSFGISAIYILESGNGKDSWMDNWDAMTYNEFCDEISKKFSPQNKQTTIESFILP
ncbi:MAG TPA: protein kinase family protein, partial [Bacteroidales bacterium]|nr:protein kinase family protein [Bacteroidales bacterium]